MYVRLLEGLLNGEDLLHSWSSTKSAIKGILRPDLRIYRGSLLNEEVLW